MDNIKKTITEILHSYTTMGYFLRHARVHMDGSMDVAHITFVPHKPGMVVPEDARLAMSQEDLQSLMDGLWALGLRPSTKLSDTKGVLEAVGKHLEDMRTLVFHPPVSFHLQAPAPPTKDPGGPAHG